jgi:hypothetical protein
MARPAGADTPQFDPRYPDWNQVLRQFVKDGGVDYPALKNNPVRLNDFLQSVSHLSEREYEGWNGKQKIAFWINTYNALAIKVIFDHYPPKKGLSWKALAYPETSIQQIPNVWDRPLIKIFGENFSLNRIEHKILRKEFEEPRIHFALVCAAKGCPPLRKEAYVAERLNTQLDDQARQFFSDPKKAKYDAEANALHLSPILSWFRKDFEMTGGPIEFAKRFMPKETTQKPSGAAKIKWLDYDWSLKEIKA